MKLRNHFDNSKRGYQAAMARHFGFTRSYLSQLADGKAPISPELALKFEAYTNGAVTRVDMILKWQSIWPDYLPPADIVSLPSRSATLPSIAFST